MNQLQRLALDPTEPMDPTTPFEAVSTLALVYRCSGRTLSQVWTLALDADWSFSFNIAKRSPAICHGPPPQQRRILLRPATLAAFYRQTLVGFAWPKGTIFAAGEAVSPRHFVVAVRAAKVPPMPLLGYIPPAWL